LKTPSNFASVLTNVVTILGLLYIARSATMKTVSGKVVFTGKPQVDMTIVEDAANTEDFPARERGYRIFMQRCFELALAEQQPIEAGGGSPKRGTLSRAGSTMEEVANETFDDYEPSNLMRSRLYLDRGLLGLLPNERVIHSWIDTKRHGFQYAVLGGLALIAFTLYVSYFTPNENIRHMLYWTASVVFVARIFHYYIELRREEQGLGVITDSGRVVQLSRRPLPNWMAPWRGGVSVKLDIFHVGDIYLAQLDMPTEPVARDRARAAGIRKPWRRGTVAIRCEHGFLQIARKHGEILDVYKAVTTLMNCQANEGLRPIGEGGADVDGFSTSELLLPGERHIWERKMEAYGFFGDPFNYFSVLSITDRRVVVSRARTPKPLSLIGILLGPLTFGTQCRALQEVRGTHAYLTVTCIGHKGVESYATTRTRSPPFWPGFMAPITSISFTFLARFMNIYPAGLFVTQRPYGMSLGVKLKGSVWLERLANGLTIVKTEDKNAPRGHCVAKIRSEWNRKISVFDARWSEPGGSELGRGCRLKFEAADPEWNTYADDPWLTQVRQVLDQALGRSTAPEEAWRSLEDPTKPAEDTKSRLLARFVGSECLGHPVKWPKQGQKEHNEDSASECSDAGPAWE